MGAWAYTFVSVVIVSLLSLIGIFFLSLQESRLWKVLLYMVSFAVGGLLGDAFIHLIPASIKEISGELTAPLLLLAGILLFFIVEKLIRWSHRHGPAAEHHVQPVVALNLIGDGVHNTIDGMLIGASYLVSIPIGLTTTLAVVLHEIPHELGNFSILVHGGLSVKRALFFNFLSALAAVLGGLISLLIGPHVGNYSQFMLPVTAGGFIYIAAADLIPELQNEIGLRALARQFVFIALGIALMAVLVVLE